MVLGVEYYYLRSNGRFARSCLWVDETRSGRSCDFSLFRYITLEGSRHCIGGWRVMVPPPLLLAVSSLGWAGGWAGAARTGDLWRVGLPRAQLSDEDEYLDDLEHRVRAQSSLAMVRVAAEDLPPPAAAAIAQIAAAARVPRAAKSSRRGKPRYSRIPLLTPVFEPSPPPLLSREDSQV